MQTDCFQHVNTLSSKDAYNYCRSEDQERGLCLLNVALGSLYIHEEGVGTGGGARQLEQVIAN